MSVTFQPAINYKKYDETELYWTADFVAHVPFKDYPVAFQVLQNNLEDTIDFWFYEQGKHSLKYWDEFARSYGMKLYEDYPHKKIYVDGMPYKVVIVLNGEPKEHAFTGLSIANTRARILFELLEIPEAGTMNPIAFLKHIERAKSKNLSEYTQEHTDERRKDPTAPLGLGDGPRMIGYGHDESRLMTYFLQLEDLCDHCIRYECDITWG